MTERLQVLVGRYGRHIGTLLYAIELNISEQTVFVLGVIDSYLVCVLIVRVIYPQTGKPLDMPLLFFLGVLCWFVFALFFVFFTIILSWTDKITKQHVELLAQTERKGKE